MEHDTFIKWLKEVFIPECQAINGIHILHLDGHRSHVSLAAILLCCEYNITLICLPVLTKYYKDKKYKNLDKENFIQTGV